MWFLHIAPILGVVSFVAAARSECKLFRDLGDATQYICSKECMERPPESFHVDGTIWYSMDSDICMASLHAGALNMSGGTVKVEKKHLEEKRSTEGTCRNRVCSRTRANLGLFYKVTETTTVITSPVGGDVMLIHNNYFNNKLQLMCLTEDSTAHFNGGNIRLWNFKRDSDVLGDTRGPSKVYYETKKDYESNRHALHCMGQSVASDVLATMTYEDAKYKSDQHTWRCSMGENLNITINKEKGSNNRTELIRYAGSNHLYSHVTPLDLSSQHFMLRGVTPEDNGLYRVGNRMDGAYFNILVRDCEAGKFGPECNKLCPECQNGGQCHSYTGECICPPGFRGSECQHACPPGTFGSKCNLRCIDIIQELSTQRQLIRNQSWDSCRGLTVCLPNPLGCSCFPGYKGPFCLEKCSLGAFGSGCSESCFKNCHSNTCDVYNGSCNWSTPSPPEIRLEDGFSVSIFPPTQRGGRLVNCSLQIDNEICSLQYKEDGHMNCQFKNLQPGEIYVGQGWCCNVKFCGNKEQKELTMVPKPVFDGFLVVRETTNSSIIISLPRIIKEGRGNSSFFIVVEHVMEFDEGITNLQDKARKISGKEALTLVTGKQHMPNLRESTQISPQRSDACKKTIWIAAQILANTDSFEVGEGGWHSGYFNCPLREGESYYLGILAITALNDKSAVIWQELNSSVIMKNGKSVIMENGSCVYNLVALLITAVIATLVVIILTSVLVCK